MKMKFFIQKKYPIHLGDGILANFEKKIPPHLKNYHFAIITDNTVKRHYGDKLLNQLKNKHFSVKLFSFKPGEYSKSRETKEKIETFLLKNKFGRDTCLIALGGGVVGDITGFVASTYMRGIPYIQVPTTLLSMLDSSVGGKTGINTPEGKNLIGCFWDPAAVIADLNCLDTLTEKQKINGWVEALKIFMTCDKVSFKKSSLGFNADIKLIKKAILLKAKIVSADPYEKHERAILNFGHTIGHAVEKFTDYKIPHGYAVGYGILLESCIAFNRGLISKKILESILKTFENIGIYKNQFKSKDMHSIIGFTKADKKAVNKQVKYILLDGIGKVYRAKEQVTHAISDSEVIAAFNTLIKGD